jgi:adenosine deaminase
MVENNDKNEENENN